MVGTSQPFLNNLWRWKCGLPEIDIHAKPIKQIASIKQILKDNWSNKFIQLMKNRIALGYFRYGPVLGNDKKYDNINSAIKRLRKYQESGNQEHLVDAANLCLVEFMQENHPNTHFESIDDGEHTKQI